MKKHTRREFLEKAIAGAMSGAALTTIGGSVFAGMQPGQERRAYTAGRFGIMLDEAMAGWLHSAEGGHAVGRAGAGMKYEDITLNCGTGMSRDFYDWLAATLNGKHVRKNGAISTCDYDFKVVSTLEFSNGLISEFGMPALDAASKDEGKMTLKISPEYTRAVAGPGAKTPPPPHAAKKWLPSNFRLQIAGLDCTHVNKIEAITIKQKVVEGSARINEKEQAHLEYPNLAISLPQQHAASLVAWHKESASSTERSPRSRKNGQIDYLTPDLKEELFTLTFSNLGIIKLTPDKPEAGNENIRRIKAEMYCEAIHFSYGPGSTWA